MKPTILITGGAGYIGSHTALRLAQRGYGIIIIDSLIHGQPFNHPWATLIKADFADHKALIDIFTHHNIIGVMHFAALAQVGESVAQPLRYYQNNVIKTIQLIEIMLDHNVKNFVFSSSCSVYGVPEYLPLTEEHPCNPISPYGKGKYMVELALKDCAQAYGLNYVSLRYFNAAGALPEHGLGEYHVPETHIIPLAIRAAKNKTPFSIFGTDYPTPDGTCIRDYVHVDDIAYAHQQALEHLLQNKPSEIFNLGSGDGYSVKQIINSIEKTMDTKMTLAASNRRPGDPAQLIADATRANTILNWKPRYTLDAIIKTALIADQHVYPIQKEKATYPRL